MKKVMISQRMKDVPDDVIQKNRKELEAHIRNNLFPHEDVEIVDSYFEDYPASTIPNKPVWYLGKSIQKLADADALVVEAGANEARGCKIEITVAHAYGIDVYDLGSSEVDSPH
mgnify:CR=1 FL=1